MIKTKPEVRFESALRKTLCGDLEEKRIASICKHFIKYALEFARDTHLCMLDKNCKSVQGAPDEIDEDDMCDICKRPLLACKCNPF